MAAPNIKSPSVITGKTARYSATTVIGAALSNAAASGKSLKINSIFCANIDGINSADVSISIYNGSTDTYFVFNVTVPPKATQIVSTKETYFYLEEGDSIRAIASANGDIAVVIGYEEFS